ncbi:tandem-95 repeat protein, partial [Uliginosibacterium sp. 31-12]|uniref:tandem-95 repeat protein n=1 Tax=Uliginosibacterium sp. 31-12 TaxID=3062781 RepID=UPI0026E2D230
AGAQTVTEDTAKAITGVSVADVDSSSLTTTVSVLHGTLSVTTGGGATITNNGTGTVTLVGTAAQINAALAGLSYTNTADYNGTDTVTVVTSDGTLSDTDSIAITVNPVADIANDTVTTNEDTLVNINVNSNDSFENSGHTITAINGSAIAVGGSVAVTNGSVTLKADGTLDFTPTANYNGAASFTYTVTSGGVSETATVNVTVAAVNDTPVNTVAGAQTVTEDTAKAITGVSVADVDSSSLTTTVSVLHGTLSVTTGGGATITNNGTGTVTLVGTAAQINAALAGLSYTNTADYNGTDTVTVVTSDGTLSDTDSIAITVNPVTDIANDTVTTNEDTLVNINVNSNDSFENSGHTITAINGSAIAVGGSVAVTNGSVTLKADGTLDFTPTANYNGAASFTYTVTSGGVSETATVNVTVAAVNDAPVNTMPASFTTLEDTSKALTGLSISDVDAGTGTLTVTLVVNNGVLNVSGGGASIAGSGSSIVTLTGTVAQINATLAASVNYVPNSNFNGTDTLAMSTSDGGNTGSGGTLTDNDSVSITVTPVNDAPVNSLATSYSTVEDTALKLSGLSVADVDAASGSMSVTLNVSSGSLAATSGSGVTISGSGTSALTLTGTLSSLNAYLASSSSMPVFTPASNATAAVTLTMTTNDNGNTGGAALTDVDTRTITITPVNDAAVLTADSATTNEDTAVSGNVLSNDTDVDSALTVGSFTWNGTTYSAGATATITGVGSLRIGSNGAYTFTPASNYNGSVPTATYSVLEDGSTSASSTLSLGITPVNDAPVNTVKTFSTSAPTTGTTYISLGGMSVTDVDAGTSTITVTFKVSTAYGTLAATGSTASGVTSSTSTTGGVQTLTLTGTLTAINTYLALTTGTNAAGNGLKFSTTSASTTGTADLTMTSSDGSLTDTDVTTITIAETSTTGNADPDAGTLTEDATTSLTGNVLTNDQGNTKSVSLVSFEGVTQTVGTAFSTNYGTLTITSTGAYTYTVNNSAVQYLAAGQSITETIVYRETYSTGTDTSTLTITITGANDAPVISATSVAVTGTEDTSYVFSWSQFGISDVDTSNTLYVQVSTLPSDGTLQYYNGSAWVSVTAGQNISKSDIDSGYFRFVPDSNESGADIYGASGTGNMKNDYASFTFKGYDGTTTSSATGTVTIDITPVADDAKLTVGGVSVIDGSTLIVTPPASDGLTVRQYTSIGNISTATVDTLAEVQSLLTLLDANTASSTTISTTPQNYTANTNSDPSGIPTDGATRITGLIYLEAGHTYTFSSYMDDTALLVVGGTVLMAKQYNSWGNITATSYTVTVSGYYTIDWAVYNGNSIGAFKPYLSVDGGTALELTSSNFLIYSSLAAVEAAGGVHDAVVGSSTAGYYPVSNSGVEDTAISISPITISLSDSDGSESMVSLVATDLLVGTVLTDGTNTFTATSGNTSVNITSWNLSTLKITPPLNFSGNYSLELTLTSKENATGELATNSTTLTIPVAPVQDAPVSANDTASVVEDSGSYVVSGNVMSNDSDPDGDAITVTAVNRQSALLGADVASLYGYFHINADGSYTYTLNNDDARVNALNTSQTLTDSITYTIADTEGLTSTSTLTITINGASDSYSTSSTISGTTGADSLSGTSAADLIQSLAGNDYIEAGAGHDVVRTGDASGTATQTELAASAFMTTADASMTDSNGLLTVADATHKAYGDLANGGTGNDALIGTGSGTHLLYGGVGDDYLVGGSGSDALRGGEGNDRLEGGAGNDVMRGDLGADVFAWSLNDQASASGTTAALDGNVYGVAAGIGLSSTTDLVTDFSKADGDVLDLRDLLSGESHLGVDPGNLSNYLHFEVSNGNTVVHISSTGGFTSGTYDATKEDQTIVLQGVNLLNDGTASLLSDNAVIQDMLKNNRLIVD